jgi:multidrug efflux pump subunit AcrA (membrane-fusion protein)
VEKQTKDKAVQMFNPEALHRYRAGSEANSEVLRSPRGWLNRGYWLLFGVAVAAAVFISTASFDEYATGPGVIRAIGQTSLTVQVSGTVHSVTVTPGEHVSEGQILAELETTVQAAEAERVQREFEGALAVSLRDPSDTTARKQVAALQAQQQVTQAGLEQRLIRSPRTGTVGDVRIRAGQPVAAGDVAVVLTPEHARFRLVMALPGQYRPLLKSGLGTRLELTGFKFAYQSITLDSVANDVVGPQEARRFLGAEIGDAIALNGPVVIGEALLPSDGFTADGHFYNYYDGMHGIAQVRAKRTRVLVLLLPWVRTLIERNA